jgi:hypothetical protein
MSNSLLQSDPDALRDSAIAVITYVRDAMNAGVELLTDHNSLLKENQSEHRLDAEIRAINENLKTTLNKKRKMSLINFNDLQRKESEIPIITDKILVDLVNSIQVNDELISFRQKQGLFGQFLDSLTGADRNRQIAIDRNVNIAMESLHSWVLDIANNLNVSNNAIVTIEEKLIETRQTIRNHRQEINLLTDIVNQLQSRVENHDHRILSLEQRADRKDVEIKIIVSIQGG